MIQEAGGQSACSVGWKRINLAMLVARNHGVGGRQETAMVWAASRAHVAVVAT